MGWRLPCLLACLPLCFLLALPAGAAITFNQGTQNSSGIPGTIIAATYASVGTSGDTRIACVTFNNITSDISSVSGSTNGAFTAVGSIKRGATQSSQCFYKGNTTAEAETVTATLSASAGYREIHILEYESISTSNPQDVSSSNIGSSTFLDSGSATTRFANELILGYLYIVSAATCGTGFTPRTNTGAKTCERIVSRAGSYTATGTGSPSAEWIAWIVTFKDVSQPAAMSR